VEKLFTGWGFRVSEFCFFLLVFYLPSVALAGKYSVWSAEGWQVGGQRAGGAEAWWASRRASVAWGWQPACFFSVLWHGADFHRLGVQGAEVSALPGALPQPSVSLASQQGPRFKVLVVCVCVLVTIFVMILT
jgi:hypothetical protein